MIDEVQMGVFMNKAICSFAVRSRLCRASMLLLAPGSEQSRVRQATRQSDRTSDWPSWRAFKWRAAYTCRPILDESDSSCCDDQGSGDPTAGQAARHSAGQGEGEQSTGVTTH